MYAKEIGTVDELILHLEEVKEKFGGDTKVMAAYSIADAMLTARGNP